MDKTRVCSYCKVEKILSNEYFHHNKNSKDGFNTECKECRNIKKKIYREENKAKLNQYNNKYQQQESNKEKAKQYYNENREKIIKRYKEYSQRNKSKARQYNIENREYIAKRKKEYQKNNAELFANYAQIRKSRQNKLLATLTVEQWGQIKKEFNDKCAYCGRELPLAREHFVPLTKGGEYTYNNIIPSCKNCNSSKYNKDFFEWYPTYKYYDKTRENKILKHLGYTADNTQQLALL